MLEVPAVAQLVAADGTEAARVLVERAVEVGE
jgi:hypothetical protein